MLDGFLNRESSLDQDAINPEVDPQSEDEEHNLDEIDAALDDMLVPFIQHIDRHNDPTGIISDPARVPATSPPMIAIEDVPGEVAEAMDVDVIPKTRPVQPALDPIYVESSQLAASASENRAEPLGGDATLETHFVQIAADPIEVECSQPKASTNMTWSTGGFELDISTGKFKKRAGAAPQTIVHLPLKKMRQASLSVQQFANNSAAASSAAPAHVPSTAASSSASVRQESGPASSAVAEPLVVQPAPPQKTISTLSPEDRTAALLQSGYARHRVGTLILLNEERAFLLHCWREDFDTLTMPGNDEIRKYIQLVIKNRRLDAAHPLQTVRNFFRSLLKVRANDASQR